jgi:hypothetical protein
LATIIYAILLLILDFSNAVQKTDLEKLAESDSHEVVREVHEYFADYLAINSNLFSLNVGYPNFFLFADDPKQWNNLALTRTMEGLTAVLLVKIQLTEALKKKPLIRYENNSALARKLASEILVMFY